MRWLALAVPLIILGFVVPRLGAFGIVRRNSESAALIQDAERRAGLVSGLRRDLRYLATSVGIAVRGGSLDRTAFAQARSDYGHVVDGASRVIDTVQARMHTIAPLFDSLGAAFALILMGLCIVAARQHAGVLEENRRIAERRARELDAFAGRVAHDLRNPLNAIAFRIATAGRHHPANAPLVGELQRVGASVGRMNALIDGLLGFAQAGARSERGAQSDLTAVLERVVEDIAPAGSLSGLKLVLEPFATIAVACPPGPLSSVLGNLLGNAIKFTGDAPAQHRRVTVRVERRQDYAHIEIQDSGPGIPTGMERAIFEPFVRAGTSTRPGLGLGLATVKRIVDAYGGTVFVAPRDGIGTTMVLELPAATSIGHDG